MNTMKLNLAGIAAAVGLLVGCEAVVAGESAVSLSAADKAEIREVLRRYETALNASDEQAVLNLYAADPVVMMAETSPTVGPEALKGFYHGTFQAIDVNLKFEVAEVQGLGPLWAMLRSTSRGTVKILANGAEVPGAFQELFLLRKENKKWKIARYSFSSTLPAAK